MDDKKLLEQQLEVLWRDGYHAAARIMEAQQKEIKRLKEAVKKLTPQKNGPVTCTETRAN